MFLLYWRQNVSCSLYKMATPKNLLKKAHHYSPKKQVHCVCGCCPLFSRWTLSLRLSMSSQEKKIFFFIKLYFTIFSSSCFWCWSHPRVGVLANIRVSEIIYILKCLRFGSGMKAPRQGLSDENALMVKWSDRT